MTDIHMHLIPGVDDGAEDLEMALAMLTQVREQGISNVICTPHSSAFDYSAEEVRDGFRLLRERANCAYPDMNLYLGCEVYCEEYRMDQVVEAVASGDYPTLNGTNRVLAEFSQWVSPENAMTCVETLVQAGGVPVIAHMERYRQLWDDMELADRFLALGAELQINAYSLFDEREDSIKNWARRLVLERKVTYLGTDAHRTNHRPPSVRMGLKWLYENCDQSYGDQVAWKNAEKLLLDRHRTANNRKETP